MLYLDLIQLSYVKKLTVYLEMRKGLEDSGVENWTFDTKEMTIIY